MTFSPGPAHDYLDADLVQHLKIPKEAFYDHEHSSVVGLMQEIFAKTGTSTWVNNPFLSIFLLCPDTVKA
jgi:hypothetical protein